MINKKTILFLLTIFILITGSSIASAEDNDDNDKKTISTIINNMTSDNTRTDNNITLLTFRNNNTTNTSDDTVQDKLDKNRQIYFAMDHTNANDEQIRDTIINRLKEEGFNVASAEVGPNKMSQNTLYLYEHNISNAIVFHLFNGVDPSTIRELATNGTDNRGRIVRQRGNDVVLAWFYDSVDCVNDNATGTAYIHGSETGPMLKNPKDYMDDNDIIAICTSSDMGKHKENADYTGERTVEEFIKLFDE